MFKNKNKNNKNNKKKEEIGFEITQERIDIVNKAAKYLKQIDDFCGFVDENFYGHNVVPYYYIMEDFVKSNEHIIRKINKVMPMLN
jgi:hypothetical protein